MSLDGLFTAWRRSGYRGAEVNDCWLRVRCSAGNCGLARKARRGRVRAALCREQDRCIGASPSHRSGPEGDRGLARTSAKDTCGDCREIGCSGVRPAPASQSPVASTVPPTAETVAERRQVTVMFSDLVGSTALSARMDPEDLREVISAYQNCVAETVQRFGGFVAKYMGDGVLVYFGYPQAHEDDAERAVRGGLELIASCQRAKVQRSTANPRWHCDWLGRRWRSDRSGCGTGASGCRRDTEPCSAPPGDCRAEHGGHCREHAKAPGQSVRP